MATHQREKNAIRLLQHIYSALNDYHLVCFGDDLAHENSFPMQLGGLDAIHYYLFKKYGWTIAECQAMNSDQLRLAMTEELSNWKAPDNARFELPLPTLEQLLEKK